MAQSVGAANVAAGLRDAFLSGSPVIAVTGGPHPDSRYKYLYQVIEDFPMFEPVTKFNARVDKPSRLADLLRQAFRVATTGSPGPVHLELPGRLGEGINGEGDFDVIVEKQHSRYPHRPSRRPKRCDRQRRRWLRPKAGDSCGRRGCCLRGGCRAGEAG